MSGSRLTRDNLDRLVCIDTGGHLWLVLDPYAVFGFEPPGRPPCAEELRLTKFAASTSTYRPVAERRKVDPDDAELAEAEAIRLARLEQQREPVDVVNVAASSR
jgi:hypothetical protein